jgi:tripartite ATP-independent transporter DctP family solute receptor
MKHTLKALALSLSLVALAATGALAEIRDQTVKFASANSAGHPQVIGMEKFAELVTEKSGGKIKVQLFPGGTLGGDVQTLSALQGGTVEMLVVNAGLLAGNAKQFGAVDLPFLFGSPEEADKVMDGAFGDSLLELLPAHQLVGLAFWELGFRNLTNNVRPVTKVEDIAGLKIRTLQAPIAIDLFNTLGANAVPMPYTELYSALDTGTVDGQENPFANVLNAKFYEVQKYLTVTQHQYNPQIVLIGLPFWDKLNDEEKAVLKDAAEEARTYQRQVSREQEAKARADVAATGMEITELAPEEMERLRQAVQPVVDRFRDTLGAETIDLLYSEVEKARQ